MTKNQNNIAIGVIILLVVFGVAFIIISEEINDRNKFKVNKEELCLEKINYSSVNGGYYYLDYERSKNFKTQEEAMNYCIKVTLK